MALTAISSRTSRWDTTSRWSSSPQKVNRTSHWPSRPGGDCITYPLGGGALARMREALRRRAERGAGAGCGTIRRGTMTISYPERSVTISGRTVQLPMMESNLLWELATNAGRIMSHNDLIDRAWGPGSPRRLTNLRAAIKNLIPLPGLGDDDPALQEFFDWGRSADDAVGDTVPVPEFGGLAFFSPLNPTGRRIATNIHHLAFDSRSMDQTIVAGPPDAKLDVTLGRFLLQLGRR